MINNNLQQRQTHALPLHTISVKIAATVYAYDLGGWGGRDFTEAETKPFEEPDDDFAGLHSSTSPHGWNRLELTGAALHARSALEAIICRDIEAGRLQALRERRDLSGALIVDDTLLTTNEVRTWAQTYGLEGGASFERYCMEEMTIEFQAIAAIEQAQSDLVSPITAERAVSLMQTKNIEGVRKIVAENDRLRNALYAQANNDLPLDPRERATLLCIIAALAKMAKMDLTHPHSAAKEIGLRLPGDVKVSAGVIAKHLQRVSDAVESRKF